MVQQPRSAPRTSASIADARQLEPLLAQRVRDAVTHAQSTGAHALPRAGDEGGDVRRPVHAPGAPRGRRAAQPAQRFEAPVFPRVPTSVEGLTAELPQVPEPARGVRERPRGRRDVALLAHDPGRPKSTPHAAAVAQLSSAERCAHESPEAEVEGEAEQRRASATHGVCRVLVRQRYRGLAALPEPTRLPSAARHSAFRVRV